MCLVLPSWATRIRKCAKYIGPGRQTIVRASNLPSCVLSISKQSSFLRHLTHHVCPVYPDSTRIQVLSTHSTQHTATMGTSARHTVFGHPLPARQESTRQVQSETRTKSKAVRAAETNKILNQRSQSKLTVVVQGRSRRYRTTQSRLQRQD